MLCIVIILNYHVKEVHCASTKHMRKHFQDHEITWRSEVPSILLLGRLNYPRNKRMKCRRVCVYRIINNNSCNNPNVPAYFSGVKAAGKLSARHWPTAIREKMDAHVGTIDEITRNYIIVIAHSCTSSSPRRLVVCESQYISPKLR